MKLKYAVDKLSWEMIRNGDIIRAECDGFSVVTWRVAIPKEFDGFTRRPIFLYEPISFFTIRQFLRRIFRMKPYVIWELRISK